MIALVAPAFIGVMPVYLVIFPWVVLTPVSFSLADAFFHWVGMSPSTRHPWQEILHALIHPSCPGGRVTHVHAGTRTSRVSQLMRRSEWRVHDARKHAAGD